MVQYQALWDMPTATILNHLGNSVEKWQQLLRDIKAERAAFDNHEQDKEFGFIVVDYAAVQVKVNDKYDAWHRELLKIWQNAWRVNGQVPYFCKSSRTELELRTLDADTSELIEYVSQVHSLRHNINAWSADMEVFKSSQRLLQSQRFNFPSDWMWLTNIEGEWDAFSQILDRKWKDMEVRIPALQKRILAEEHPSKFNTRCRG